MRMHHTPHTSHHTTRSAVLYPCVSNVLATKDDPVLALIICLYGCVIAAMAYNSFIVYLDTGSWQGFYGSLIFVVRYAQPRSTTHRTPVSHPSHTRLTPISHPSHTRLTPVSHPRVFQ